MEMEVIAKQDSNSTVFHIILGMQIVPNVYYFTPTGLNLDNHLFFYVHFVVLSK